MGLEELPLREAFRHKSEWASLLRRTTEYINHLSRLAITTLPLSVMSTLRPALDPHVVMPGQIRCCMYG